MVDPQTTLAYLRSQVARFMKSTRHEQCAAEPRHSERKTRSKTNLSPRQGMRNSAVYVSLKFPAVGMYVLVLDIPTSNAGNYRNLFPGEGRKSLPRIYVATNPLVNRHLSLPGIGEALAPSCILSWGRPIARQIPMMTRVLLALAVLATAFTWGSGSPRTAFPSSLPLSELSESLHHRPQEDESQVKEFKGKILKSDGRFVLEESSNGGHYGTYLLDDQARKEVRRTKSSCDRNSGCAA